METQEVPLRWGVCFRGFWSARENAKIKEKKLNPEQERLHLES